MATILVVDDDQSVRSQVQGILRDKGHTVDTAASAGDALELLNAHQFDAAVVDIELPDMSGTELVSSMRAKDAHVQVVMVSDEATVKVATDVLRAGASDLLFKPIIANAVARSMENALRIGAVLRENARVEKQYRTLFKSSLDAIMILAPPDWRFASVNPACLAMFGAEDGAALAATTPWNLSPKCQADGCRSDEKAREMLQTAIGKGSHVFEWRYKRLDGEEFPATVQLIRIRLAGQTQLQATVRDETESRQLEADLAHAQKLEAVGQLAAGIAHEINTPTQFVGDSVHFLEEACEDLTWLVKRYRTALETLETDETHAELLTDIKAAEEKADLEYLREHMAPAFARCREGIGRIATIVSAMKEFAHPDSSEKQPADINHALADTLTISCNEYKYVADVKTHFGAIPLVECLIGNLNQVFLNLIVNAAHAVGAKVEGSGEKGMITVRTSEDGDDVLVEVSDTGCGMPPEVRTRIFDPFFTTKGVGKGSGQGLAIARSIIVDKHQGTITCDSTPGKGTTFTVRIPIKS